VELTRLCQSALREAEQKVQKLVSENNQSILTPFDEDEQDA